MSFKINDATKGVIGNAIANITSRADLIKHPISSHLIAFLCYEKSLTVEDIQTRLKEYLEIEVSKANVKKAIAFTNEKLRLIDNLDPGRSVCVAYIYTMTCEVGSEYIDRIFLVHNQ